MQAIRQTQQLNKAELEKAVPPEASWHRDYKDTAYIYIGGLPLDLSEGDVVTIFSQYGHPTHLNMIRDKETGKSKGFAFLKYEDQRSCDLAVDNLGGAEVLGRMLRVDHTRYKKRDDEDEETYRIDKQEDEINENGKRVSDTDSDHDDEIMKKKHKKPRRMLKEERELEEMLRIKETGENEDPMADYLISEKRQEVDAARARQDKKEKKHKHNHKHHRDGHNKSDGQAEDSKRSSGKHRHRGGGDRHERRDELEREHKHRSGVGDVDEPSRRDRSRRGHERGYSDEEHSRRWRRRSTSRDDGDERRSRRRSTTPDERDRKGEDGKSRRGGSRDRERDRDQETRRRRGGGDYNGDKKRTSSRDGRRRRNEDD